MAGKGVEIKSLKLKVGDKEVELTMSEAKELKNALDGLFGKEVIKIVNDRWNWWYPYLPPTIYPSVPFEPYKITWDAGSVSWDSKNSCLSLSVNNANG